MKRLTRGFVVLYLGVAGVAGTVSTANAAGYSIYEQGASATAQAGALIARANDPSAIFYNVAGIAGQGKSVSIGATVISVDNQFTGEGAYPGNGVVEKQVKGTFYPPHAYVVMPLGGGITAGLGVFAPFGLGTEWDPAYTGRASSVKASIEAVFVNPVVAYEYGPLSVGAGLNILAMSSLSLTRTSIQPVLTQWTTLARAEIEGDGDPAIGFNLGVRYKPMDMLTVGASYRSEIAADHSGTAKFHDIAPLAASVLPANADVEAMVPYPAIMGVGVAVEPIPGLSVEFNLIEMKWSVFDTLKLVFEDDYSMLNESIAERYEDARSYRVGAEYRVSDELALRCGYLFDESPCPDASVSTLLPDADRNSYMVGAGYTLGQTTFDLAYMYLPFNDRSTEGENRSGYNGLYETTAHLFGLTATFRF
jgi:long-chain fatty acid transport protein